MDYKPPVYKNNPSSVHASCCPPLFLTPTPLDPLESVKIFQAVSFENPYEVCQTISKSQCQNMVRASNRIKPLNLLNRDQFDLMEPYLMTDKKYMTCLRTDSDENLLLFEGKLSEREKTRIQREAYDISMEFYDRGFTNIPINVYLGQEPGKVMPTINPFRINEIKARTRLSSEPTMDEIAVSIWKTS